MRRVHPYHHRPVWGSSPSRGPAIAPGGRGHTRKESQFRTPAVALWWRQEFHEIRHLLAPVLATAFWLCWPILAHAGDESATPAQAALRSIAHIACEQIAECSGPCVWTAPGSYTMTAGMAGALPEPNPGFTHVEILPIEAPRRWIGRTSRAGRRPPGRRHGRQPPARSSGALPRRYHAPQRADRPPATRCHVPLPLPRWSHDSEALTVIDGAVHVITKARGEKETYVYKFDELRDVAVLEPGR